jgi:Holliday junction resolvasome RuvABC endonuclease subunit
MFKHVIGIDPSLTACAIADADSVLVYGGDSKFGDTRLETIYAATLHHVRRAQVDPADILVVMEDLPMHAKAAGITGMVQGVIRLALVQERVAYTLVIPSSLKAYGSGKAEKADLRVARLQRTGVDERNDNKNDAWWLRQAGLDAIGHPDAIQLPKAQRERLVKWRWPRGVTITGAPSAQQTRESSESDAASDLYF